MLLLHDLGLVASTTFLFSAIASAQQCYYPDGSPSTDVSCSSGGDSSCCGSQSFCMDNGLCFGGGIVSRGSCTDQAWESQACTAYCRTTSPSSSIPLSPCSGNGGSSTFVCGLGNETACSDVSQIFTLAGKGSLVLRASQVQALVGSAISSLSTPCPAANTTGLYTAGQMAGLGMGIGIPFLLTICFVLLGCVREHGRRRGPKLMYALPDENSEYNGFPVPQRTPFTPALTISPPSRAGSDTASMTSAGTSTMAGTPPAHLQTFNERYKAMNEMAKKMVHARAVELPGSPMVHELGDRRRSDTEGAGGLSTHDLKEKVQDFAFVLERYSIRSIRSFPAVVGDKIGPAMDFETNSLPKEPTTRHNMFAMISPSPARCSVEVATDNKQYEEVLRPC